MEDVARDPVLPSTASKPIIPKFAADPLAVIGIACRLPGDSNSPTALWQFLERGGIASNNPPASRFQLKGHEDGSKRPKTMRSPGGMFLESINPADIDAQFFGLSKAEAIAMDPQQRQLLEVVYECLENAGITLESLKGQSVGCFVGSYASGCSIWSWKSFSLAEFFQIMAIFNHEIQRIELPTLQLV